MSAKAFKMKKLVHPSFSSFKQGYSTICCVIQERSSKGIMELAYVDKQVCIKRYHVGGMGFASIPRGDIYEHKIPAKEKDVKVERQWTIRNVKKIKGTKKGNWLRRIILGLGE